MVTLLGHTFSVLWLLLTLMLLLVLISQFSWRVFGKYFPSAQLCLLVHKHGSAWLARERKILSSLNAPSVFGFLCTLILAAIIPLNVTLLAQIFELFVPPGDIVDLPIIGSYAIYPLMVGLLFTLVEVAFSALAEQKRKSGESLLSIRVVLAMMIVVEAGLNFYRAFILESDIEVMNTFWDKLIGFGGPALAAFLGVIVPLAMIMLGGYAMLEFIMPVIKDLAVLLRFVLGYSYFGTVVLLFGFHDRKPVMLPGPLTRLKDSLHDLRSLVKEMEKSRAALAQRFKELQPHHFVDVLGIDQQVRELYACIDELEEKYAETSKMPQPSPSLLTKDIQNKRELKREILNLKRQIRDFRATISVNAQDFESLSEQTLKAQKAYRKWKPVLCEFQRDYEITNQKINSVRYFLSNSGIAELCQSVHAALDMRSLDGSVLSSKDIDDLHRIVDPPAQLSRTERNWCKIVADASKSLLQTANTEINNAKNTYEYASNWLSEHEIAFNNEDLSAKETTLSNLERKLVAIDNRLRNIEDNRNDQFAIIEDRLRGLALELRAVLALLGLLIPLHKRI